MESLFLQFVSSFNKFVWPTSCLMFVNQGWKAKLLLGRVLVFWL